MSDKDSAHTGNASSGRVFAPEQDYSAPLLKMIRPVSDTFQNLGI